MLPTIVSGQDVHFETKRPPPLPFLIPRDLPYRSVRRISGGNPGTGREIKIAGKLVVEMGAG